MREYRTAMYQAHASWNEGLDRTYIEIKDDVKPIHANYICKQEAHNRMIAKSGGLCPAIDKYGQRSNISGHVHSYTIVLST